MYSVNKTLKRPQQSCLKNENTPLKCRNRQTRVRTVLPLKCQRQLLQVYILRLQRSAPRSTNKKTGPALSAGRKSEGLNSATYEIVVLGYMKKTGGGIERQDHAVGFSVRWFFAAGILGLDIAAAQAMRIYRARFYARRVVHDQQGRTRQGNFLRQQSSYLRLRLHLGCTRVNLCLLTKH